MSNGKGNKRKVGIVGYGHIGQYLVKEILQRNDLELSFVWNRTVEVLKNKVEDHYILEKLSSFAERAPDLIVEVAHPSITAEYGELFLDVADYMIGSPTALADLDVEKKLRKKASSGSHGVYIPSGALWGGTDIKKMADLGTLKGLKVTMKKHPSCYKLNEPLKTKNAQVHSEAIVLYDGPIRGLCSLAPNNVNTMAAAALAAHNLGFDKAQGCIVADPSLNAHIVEVDVYGPGEPENQFTVKTVRHNPAKSGAITGNATYASFLSSMLDAVSWLEEAVCESQKTDHVNLDMLISNCRNTSHCVQMLLSIEEDTLKLGALEELLISLKSYLEILCNKKMQLDCGNTTDLEIDPVKSENDHCKRRKIAIQDTIVLKGSIKFCDVVGLNDAKQALKEAIIMPLQFPQLFTGGRQPWRRILLYGPPGTGKTRLAQAVASEINSIFYSVSSSDLVSSWVGESEKLIKELFQNARSQQVQSVIFIDEIDSICRKRSVREEEYTRRIKTELLKQMEDADHSTSFNKRFILLCATNCPWELDTAFLRRFQKRIYIPLPDKEARITLIKMHLAATPASLTAEDWCVLGKRTEGFSGSDLSNCTSDAMFEPIRELENTTHWKLNKDLFYVPCSETDDKCITSSMTDLPSGKIQPRPVKLNDFLNILSHNTSTVAKEDLERFEQFTINLGQRG